MSPAAKTPSISVIIVLKPTLTVPHFVTGKSLTLKSVGKFSGEKPRAAMTISAFKLKSDPSIC